MTDLYAQIIRQNGGLNIEDAVNWLKNYKEVAGDDTQYWYRYVCKTLDRADLLMVGHANPPPRIFVHLATLAIITQEFQSIMLEEESMVEHEYGSYLEDLSMEELEDLYRRFVKGNDALDDGEDWRRDCEDEYDLREKLSEWLIENNRDLIVDRLKIGKQGDEKLFEALVLTVRFPCADFEKYADLIEKEFPIDAEDIRSRLKFESYSEFIRYLDSDDASEFIYGNGCGIFDPALQNAYDWFQCGCLKSLFT